MAHKVVIASGNPGKLAELNNLLAGLDLAAVPQSEFAITDAVESGRTFVENAILKARHASHYAKLPAIADDSGLEVDYLRGAPGIYSARFSGEGASDEKNNRKLLGLLQDIPVQQRTARYQCLLVYLRHPDDPTPIICHGTWEGTLISEPRGTRGFGYDPLFFVAEYQCTAAELDPELKNRISHRGRAMQQLLVRLASN